jgi:hypothetical protein
MRINTLARQWAKNLHGLRKDERGAESSEVILVLVLLGQIERLLLHRNFERIVQVAFEPGPEFLAAISSIFSAAGFRAEPLDVEKRGTAYIAVFRTSGPRNRWQDALQALLASPGVHKVTPL